MEIGRWLYYAVNCALLCYIVAKPFSLNKLIESESIQNEVTVTTPLPKITEPEPAASERFSLNKGLKPLNRISKKIKEKGTKVNLVPLGKKISPLKYRKTFQIKSPLKPKRIKSSLRTRQKRKNQSIKPEVDENVILNKKYVPLLKSLGMLFDNILNTDSGESFEKTKRKKRLRFYIDGDEDVPCKCPREKQPNAKPTTEEEAVIISETLAAEATFTTEAAAETTDNPATSNIRSFRHHKNVPLLLPRNTSGTRRNNHGLSERGGTSHNGSTERYISGNTGDSKHNSKYGQEQPYAESDEEHTDSDSRNGTSSVRYRGAIRGGREYRNNTQEIYENGAKSKSEAENYLEDGEDATQHNGAFKLETKRDKAKSGKLLPEPFPRQRGIISNDEVINFTESVQSEENDKESVISIAHDGANDKRLTNGDGAPSSENKEVYAGTEALINKLPEATNQYSTKSAKTSTIIDSSDEYTESEQNNDNDEGDVNISYDNSELRSLETDDSNSIADRGPNTKSEKTRKKTTQLTKPAINNTNSMEVINANDKKDGGSMEHISFTDKLKGDKTYLIRQQVIPKPVTVDKFDENSQYMSKPKTSKTRGPVVMIIDGYSVTRHKNGENKLAEKAIRIRP